MAALELFSRSWLAWISAASWQLALLICVVAVMAVLARGLGASARLRHALWLLVLVKVFLPPTLVTPLSVGYWAVGPAWEKTGVGPTFGQGPLAAQNVQPSAVAEPAQAVPPFPSTEPAISLSIVLLLVWLSGCLVFWAVVGAGYWRLQRELRAARMIDEGPLRVVLEQIALELQVRRVPELLVIEAETSPFLLGVLRPRIVLSERLVRELDRADLQAVLTQELVHWQRRDTWIGWAQVIAQSLFWFHPFLWWANSQLRHERESACDEVVLQLGAVTPTRYGESLVRVLLAASRGRPLVAGSLAGVFERGAKLQDRLEGIMNYRPMRRTLNGLSWLGIAALAVLLLPMAPRAAEEQPAAPKTSSGSTDKPTVATEKKEAADVPADDNTRYPQIIATTPERGATEVDPALGEITVTFDRDMDTKGMSWTGSASLLPPTDELRKAFWSGPRTCVLPVQLPAKGSFYRVGINSSSYQNFRSKEGVPVPPAVICFTTKGAGDDVRVATPTVVKFDPPNGAQDVDPDTKTVSVTFSVVMGNGMSWTGSGPQYPKSPEDTKAFWSPDSRICTLPVALEPGHDYEIGINSARYNNFQSKWGVPLQPVVYKFHTRGGKN